MKKFFPRFRLRGDDEVGPVELPRGSGRFSIIAVGCVDAVRRRAAQVAIAALVVTIIAGVYAAVTLSINTDTSDMISKDLTFRQRYAEFKRVFPQFVDSIVIVIDGDSPDRADDAAMAMVERLRRQDVRFKTIYSPQTEPFFARNGLLYLDTDELADLTDRLADAQPLLTKLAADPSLRGFFEVLRLALDDVAEGGSIPTGLADVLARITDSAVAVAAGRPKPMSWSELLQGEPSDANDRRRFIMVQPIVDFTSLQPAAQAIKTIRSLAAELGLVAENGVRVRLTGGAAMATEELQSVAAGASIAGLMSLVLVAFLLIAGLRSVRLVAAVLLTLVAGLIWTAGFTALAVGHLNLMSVAFAVLFIGLGVDFGIHFGLRYMEEAGRGAAHPLALCRATAGVARPLGLCTVAAAVGFYSFIPTDYTGLSELGLIAGTGMFIALFASLTVLPALLTLMPPAAALGRAPPPSSEAKSSGSFILRHGGPISAVAAGFGVAAILLLPLARFDANPIALKDPSTESVSTFLQLLRDSETSPYTIEVVADGLDSARRLAVRLESLPEVDRALTLGSFAASNQAEKLELVGDAVIFMAPLLAETGPPARSDDAARLSAAARMAGRLAAFVASPNARELLGPAQGLAQSLARLGDDIGALAALERSLLFFLPSRLTRLREALKADRFGLEDLPADLRNRFVAPDGRARIQVFPAEDLNDGKALRRFVAAVYRVTPQATSAPVEIVESGSAVVGAVQQAALTAVILISLLLWVLLRSWRETLLVLIPLSLATLFTVAASVLLNLPFNFANVIVLPLLMGLGVASSIHLVMRAREEGGSATMARTSTPRAVVFSALTTVGSFGTLAISDHRGTASMGELLTIAIAFTLICALVFLPALMIWFRTEGVHYEAQARHWIRTEGRPHAMRLIARFQSQSRTMTSTTGLWIRIQGRRLMRNANSWIRTTARPAMRKATGSIRATGRKAAAKVTSRFRLPAPAKGSRKRHSRPF